MKLHVVCFVSQHTLLISSAATVDPALLVLTVSYTYRIPKIPRTSSIHVNNVNTFAFSIETKALATLNFDFSRDITFEFRKKFHGDHLSYNSTDFTALFIFPFFITRKF